MTGISEKFVEDRVEELKSTEEVKAVAVVGSYARNPEGQHNDLDLYTVVEGDWRKRVTEEKDSVVVEKFFNSVEWSEKYLEKEDWWRNYRWFTKADVRFDPENIFDELADKAEEVKKQEMNLSDQDLQEISYSIWDMKQDIGSEDVAQKRFMMQKLFEYLLEKQYYLKNQVPVKENYRLEKLQEFDSYMYKLSQDFLLASSTMEKEKTLEKVTEHVSKNLLDISPEWKAEREKLQQP